MLTANQQADQRFEYHVSRYVGGGFAVPAAFDVTGKLPVICTACSAGAALVIACTPITPVAFAVVQDDRYLVPLPHLEVG